MTYQTTITRKGQITIPKEMRVALHLKEGKKIFLELEPQKKKIWIASHPDITELAGTFRTKKKIDVVKAREYMEKHYERV
mgnify:FL=1